MPGLRSVRLLVLLASLGRSLGSLGRRVHRRFVGADVTEQHSAVRQILLHQAGAGRSNRTGYRVGGGHVVDAVVAPVQVHMVGAVAAPVKVVAMPPDARVDMNVPTEMNVPAVDMNVPTQVNVPAVVVDMTDHAGVTDQTRPDHTVAVAATDDAVVTAAAAIRARIRSGRDESREADSGRGDESEECSTFEHGSKTFGLDVGHPCHWSGQPRARFKRLISATFSFI